MGKASVQLTDTVSVRGFRHGFCDWWLRAEKEAKVIALCCGAKPSGHARWTLRLLAERVVELEIVESISHETVRQCLKKTC
jgi:hypothetical protein